MIFCDDVLWLMRRCRFFWKQVQLNVSRGLGLSLQITGNDVRVKGFSTVEGGEMGPAEECGQIQVWISSNGSEFDGPLP